MENFWPACISRFESELSAQQFNTWIKPLNAEMDGEKVVISAPNRFVMQWVKDRFLKKIEQFAEELNLASLKIEFIVGEVKAKAANPAAIKKPELKIDSKQISDEEALKSELAQNVKANLAKTLNSAAGKTSTKSGQHKKGDDSGLNPSFNFSNYVTGRANQLARAAAIQVAENPGMAYNPLFIYGGVGLGKTHLLQAIGNELRKHKPDAKIRYLHAERYVSDVVKAYEHKAFDEFKRQYHSLDLLLIDDIQFFAKKTRTQEEFFYAFNALIEAKKQIVITCDTYPKDITGLEDRLISRFDWGLTVAIEPPELEMRVAILKKKAEAERIEVSEDVAFLIAKHLRSNVRELEGALKKVLAFARFHGREINLEVAKEALKDLLGAHNRQITFESIQKTVAEYYKIKISDMHSKKRTRIVARPRQIAMWLAKELTPASLPAIGEAFGGRDHTTVLHACRTISDLRLKDASINHDLLVLTQVLKG